MEATPCLTCEPAVAAAAPSAVSKSNYLADYERNGYNDSDFLVIYWDDDRKEIDQFESGSTRYAGNPGAEAQLRALRRDITPEIRQQIHRHIFECIRDGYLRAEVSRVEAPGPADLPHGTEVRMIAPPSGRKRDEVWEVGEVGEVYWSGHFGRFFRKGYRQPDRSNGRLGVRFADGRRVFCPMKSVRLNREPDADRAVLEAARVADAFDVGACVSRFTWYSKIKPSLKQ